MTRMSIYSVPLLLVEWNLEQITRYFKCPTFIIEPPFSSLTLFPHNPEKSLAIGFLEIAASNTCWMNVWMPIFCASVYRGGEKRRELTVVSHARLRSRHCITFNKHFSFGTYCVLDWGFPHSSIGKEFVCNAEDPGLIPGPLEKG